MSSKQRLQGSLLGYIKPLFSKQTSVCIVTLTMFGSYNATLYLLWLTPTTWDWFSVLCESIARQFVYNQIWEVGIVNRTCPVQETQYHHSELLIIFNKVTFTCQTLGCNSSSFFLSMETSVRANKPEASGSLMLLLHYGTIKYTCRVFTVDNWSNKEVDNSMWLKTSTSTVHIVLSCSCQT